MTIPRCKECGKRFIPHKDQSQTEGFCSDKCINLSKPNSGKVSLKWDDYFYDESRVRHGPIIIKISKELDEFEKDHEEWVYKWWAEIEDDYIEDYFELAGRNAVTMEEAKLDAERWLNSFIYFIKNPLKFHPSDPAEDI